MRTSAAAVVAAIVACGPLTLHAGEHLVTAEVLQTRLAAAGETRRADLAFLGARVGPLAPVLHQLADDELRDLAVRAAALESDPHASGPGGAMIAVLVVLAVVLVAGMVLELT